jgi:glycosyltransferase involved in cell wall biosynthesis
MRLVRVAVNVEQLLYRPPGGIGRYTAKLVTLLPRLFPDVRVVAFTARHDRSEIDAVWRDAGGEADASPIRLALPRALLYEGWNTFGWLPLDWRAPGLAGVDLVHAPSVAVPPRGRAPLVVTVHDVAPALFPEAFPAHGRWFHARGLAAAARRAVLVITVSHAAAREIEAHSAISRDRLRVVPNGVDHVDASPEQITATVARHRLAGAPYILWVGSLEPRKNVATLVEAFASLVESGGAGDHRLALAGPSGWLTDDLVPASARARLGGPGGRLRLLGPVSEAELRALYAGATLFALPSRHEGFGLPVLEAMAQGTPVVCSDIAALSELTGAAQGDGDGAGPEGGGAAGPGSEGSGAAPGGGGDVARPGRDGGAARLVPPDDTDAWAAALGDLIGDDEARRRLAAAGRARAAEYSWERTVRLTRAVYSEVLSGPG